RPVYILGAVLAATWGFFAFPMMNTGDYLMIMGAAVPPRAAASSLQLSVASRLLSPVVGSFASDAGVPLLTDDVLSWRLDGHAVQFAAGTVGWHDTRNPAVAAELIDRTVVASALAPIVDRLAPVMALSPKVMWGNVISAANGAVTVAGMTDAGAVPAGRALIRSMTRLPRLHGTATTTGTTFRRHSCCLFYLTPRGGLCGDCVLHRTGSH
ncbi:(2Fe-2S)-binding protein, partial [Mycobacterium sp. NAZ190054]|uniref:(2Fe-2S)-binding protein n=1 Tax=Mycobacterium sp. NAZ190054 TaxID=1747766 RepID=UPI000791A464